MDFDGIVAEVATAGNMRKQYLIAAVDDEGELTYYEVKVNHLAEAGSEAGEGQAVGEAYGAVVLVRPADAPWLAAEGYGKLLDAGEILLSPVEALYLMDTGRLTLLRGGAPLSRETYYGIAAETDGELGERAFV